MNIKLKSDEVRPVETFLLGNEIMNFSRKVDSRIGKILRKKGEPGFDAGLISNAIKLDDCVLLENHIFKIAKGSGEEVAKKAMAGYLATLVETYGGMSIRMNIDWFSLAVHEKAVNCIKWAIENKWATPSQQIITDATGMHDPDENNSLRNECWTGRLEKFNWKELAIKDKGAWIGPCIKYRDGETAEESALREAHAENIVKFVTETASYSSAPIIDSREVVQPLTISTYAAMVDIGWMNWGDVIKYLEGSFVDMKRVLNTPSKMPGNSIEEEMAIKNAIQECERQALIARAVAKNQVFKQQASAL